MTPLREAKGARDFFRANVREYDAAHYGNRVRSFMTVRQSRILEMIERCKLPSGSRILDAGCGPGHLLQALTERGFEVWALDASEAMLAASRTRLRDANLGSACPLTQADIEQLPFAASTFDVVISAGVIEYLREDAKVLREFGRVLRAGGYLVLPTTNRLSPAGWFDDVVEALKRRPCFLRLVNRWLAGRGEPPARARSFTVRRHRPAELRRSLAYARFRLEDDLFFYFLPWPHPLDRVFPRLTSLLGEPLERLARSVLGPIAEGYLTVSTWPFGSSSVSDIGR